MCSGGKGVRIDAHLKESSSEKTIFESALEVRGLRFKEFVLAYANKNYTIT